MNGKTRSLNVPSKGFDSNQLGKNQITSEFSENGKNKSLELNIYQFFLNYTPT
jgi:hypothetical protein